MRIAQLAPLVEKVPPSGYGGTELVVSLLTEELVRRGHEVTLFASGDSSTQARLVSVVDRSLRAQPDIPQRRWAAYDMRTLLELEEMSGEFDIIHNHMGWQALPFLRSCKTAALSTNHNHIKDYCAAIYLACSGLPYVSLSNAYRRFNYPERINYVATIYNGIAVDSYLPPRKTSRSYLLFLGRVCHDKGTVEAIEIARRLGLPLKIAGKVDLNDRAYFNDRVRPLLNEPGIEYLGEVDHRQKAELYRSAVALVNPLNFDEPFGLVMSEALASGTPVMALDRGSVREVVSDGQTGVIACSVEELIQRFAEIEKISADACVDRARNLFSKEKMADEYEKVYARVIAASA